MKRKRADHTSKNKTTTRSGSRTNEDVYVSEDEWPEDIRTAWHDDWVVVGSSEDEEAEEAERENGDIEAVEPEAVDDVPENAHSEQEGTVESDSSEEELPNTVGNVPMEWYQDFPHIGYDRAGNKLLKKTALAKGEIQDFVERADNPDYWKTVYDRVNDREVVLTKDEFKLLRNIQQHKFPQGTDPFEPFMESLGGPRIHPVTNHLKPKSSFVPSKWEAKRINYLVKAIQKGWIKLDKKDKSQEAEVERPKAYLLWTDDQQQAGDLKKPGRHLPPTHPLHPAFVPPPRPRLPAHAESYNPPAEYLPTEEEVASWQLLDPSERPHGFVPTKYRRLREVPGYKNFVQERFERCLDLYLCPRVQKLRTKLVGELESLLPKLPPRDSLRPFPTKQALVYEGHSDKVRCIAVDPTGQWLASGSDDLTLVVWEVDTARPLARWSFDDPVYAVAWNPSGQWPYLAVGVGTRLVFVHPRVGSEAQCEAVELLLQAGGDAADDTAGIRWTAEGRAGQAGPRLSVQVDGGGPVKAVAWHAKGDYLVAVSGHSGRTSVVVHQVSRRRSQPPFRKPPGPVTAAQFHPSQPVLFVATQQYVRVYHLVKRLLLKKLLPGVRWISSLDVHPATGDHVIVGSYDKKVCWFDLDLSTKPYKTLRYHSRAVRKVAFHPRYPLFASASDDARLLVFHATVYSDLMHNPLLVPVKILKGHAPDPDGLGCLDCCFHPSQPWLFSCGADHSIRLFV